MQEHFKISRPGQLVPEALREPAEVSVLQMFILNSSGSSMQKSRKYCGNCMPRGQGGYLRKLQTNISPGKIMEKVESAPAANERRASSMANVNQPDFMEKQTISNKPDFLLFSHCSWHNGWGAAWQSVYTATRGSNGASVVNTKVIWIKQMKNW